VIQQLLANGIIAGAIYALVGLGFALVYRTVRFFHFAHGAVYAVGAYAAYAVMQLMSPRVDELMSLGVRESMSPGVGELVSSWVVAVAVAAVVGVGIDRLVYRPLRTRKAPALILLIASFGAFIFLQNLLQLIFGAQILTMRTGPVKEGHHVLGAVITDTQIAIMATAILVLVSLGVVSSRTRLGKAMRAVADDGLASSVVGINPERVILWAFILGSALAGLAGILISYETNIEPTMGFNALLKGIIASIIGGIGSIPGAALGGLLLGLAESLGIWKLPAMWKDTIAFGLLIVFLLARPQGILGKKPERV
jgi:branched-chain amino acid transport system permease protein